MVCKIFKYDRPFHKHYAKREIGGEWNEQFQAKTNNSSHNEGDMFFL